MSDGIIIYDKCGIPLVGADDNPFLRLHEEGEVTLPARTESYGYYYPSETVVNFTPCSPLPMVTAMDINTLAPTSVEELSYFVALDGANSNHLYYRFYAYSYSFYIKKIKWRLWVRDR